MLLFEKLCRRHPFFFFESYTLNEHCYPIDLITLFAPVASFCAKMRRDVSVLPIGWRGCWQCSFWCGSRGGTGAGADAGASTTGGWRERHLFQFCSNRRHNFQCGLFRRGRLWFGLGSTLASPLSAPFCLPWIPIWARMSILKFKMHPCKSQWFYCRKPKFRWLLEKSISCRATPILILLQIHSLPLPKHQYFPCPIKIRKGGSSESIRKIF